MQNKLRVFLSETSSDVTSHQSFLYNVLKKAELDVIRLENAETSNIQILQQKVQVAIEHSDCSIHIIGNEYEVIPATQNSVTEVQLIKAKNYIEEKNPEFRIFIWQPGISLEADNQNNQSQFITSIRNSILHNISISNHESHVSFVEDIYSVMNAQTQTSIVGKNTEVFFIYNELDEDFAKEILGLLDDVLKVEKLAFVQNAERDYSNFIIEQAKQSKLIVVFFKWATNWAMPFVQQLWRLLGGASSTIQILTIADEIHKEKFQKLLAMPNVSPHFVSEELIPLEIKVQYDRITN